MYEQEEENQNEEKANTFEGVVEEDDEIGFSLSDDLTLSSTNNTINEVSKSDNKVKKKRKFKPGKFISKLNLMKIKRDDKKLKNDDDRTKLDLKEETDTVNSPKLDSLRRNIVKRFSRRKNYKISPMASVENAASNDDEPMNNEKDLKKISKSDSNLSNNTVIQNKMNDDSLELSKSMHIVDKSIYTTQETSTSVSSFTKENKTVQLKITISGKKVEKVNTSSANEIATSKPMVNENEVEADKASLQQQQAQNKSRTDIMLPSTSTTVRASTSSSEELFNVMVPRNKSSNVVDNAANMHVLHQVKSISKSSVPYSTVVKEGLVTSSVSEREIEKYLVLTSNLNSIISAAKDIDNIDSDAINNCEFPKNLPELKIHEESVENSKNDNNTPEVIDPKSNIEKEKQLLLEKSSETINNMKKSRIPVNKHRRSSSHDFIEKEMSTVHTQEANKPYNLNLNVSSSASTEDLKEKKEEDKRIETPSPPSELKSEDIKFELGTPVRPQKILQPTPIGPIADIVITEAELLTSSKDQEESNEEVFHSPKSESSIKVTKRDSTTRRKIAYIPELSIYTTEEQELLKSNITANHSESFDIPSLPPDSSIFPVFDESSVNSMTPISPEKRECLYKILVIGELGTGKTSFIKRYVHQFFSQNYRATIGVDFALKVLSWDESTIIRLQLWDIAGQERFGNMTRVYYKEAVGAFIVFDCTRTPTFDAVNKWKQDLDSKVQLPDGSPIPCILLANKCDQPKQGLVTMPAKMDEYCKQNGFAGWFETSAKDNTNIEESAKALVSKILLNDKLIHNDMLDGDRLVLDAEDLNKPKKFCSC